MTSLAYSIEGSGPPVLLIQGVGVCGSGWRPQVDGLRSRFQCLTFDNRGIGGSAHLNGDITVERMAADAVALMNQCGWSSAHVVGHSLGGSIALELALSHPERIRSLSLLNTFARGADATGFRSSLRTRSTRA